MQNCVQTIVGTVFAANVVTNIELGTMRTAYLGSEHDDSLIEQQEDSMCRVEEALKQGPKSLSFSNKCPHELSSLSSPRFHRGFVWDSSLLASSMYNAKHQHPYKTLVTWKSDVSSAFLNLLAHPLWQLRQLVKVGSVWCIVHRLVFGNRALPRCWCAVAGLMCWIAITKLDIIRLHDFMDDFFSWD